MRSLVPFVALLAVTALLAGAVTAATAGGVADDTADETDDVTIIITVVDSNGNGIGDATVTVSWDDGNKTRTTEANGKAFVTVPDDRELEISVDHPDYVKNFPETVSNVEEEEEVVVRMTSPATETVTVVDEDGDPVEGARVSLSKSGQVKSVASGLTGADGTYTTDGIEEGEYKIRVSKSGFLREQLNVNVVGDSAHTVTVRRNSTLVRFDVTDGRLGEGVQARVSIVAGGEEVLSFRTDSNGKFEQLLPVNTRYTVVVDREGYDEARKDVNVYEDSRSVSLSINRTNDLTLDVETTQVLAGNSLRVTVVDEYGDHVSGATITLDGESVAETGDDGTATVRLDDPGRYDLVADDGTVESDPVTVRAVEPRTTTTEQTTTEPTTEETTEPTTTEPTTTEPTTTEERTTTSAAETTAATTAEADGGSPGFLVPTALGGLLAGLLFLRRRR